MGDTLTFTLEPYVTLSCDNFDRLGMIKRHLLQGANLSYVLFVLFSGRLGLEEKDVYKRKEKNAKMDDTYSSFSRDQLCQMGTRLFLSTTINGFDINATGWKERVASKFAPLVE